MLTTDTREIFRTCETDATMPSTSHLSSGKIFAFRLTLVEY